MKVRTEAPSDPARACPGGLIRGRTATAAFLIAALAVVASFSPSALGQEGVLTLEDALERALRHHPSMWEANAEALQTQLAWEGQQAQRRPQASVSTTVFDASLDSGKGGGVEVASGLTLDRPVTLSGNWQLAAGTSLSLSGTLAEDLGPQRDALSLTLTRQLWPNPSLSNAELTRQNALEAVEELPERARQAKASVLIDVYRRYRSLQIQESRVELSAAQAESAEQRYAAAVAQYEAGLASADSVIQAELERDRARASLERAERELALTRRTFFRDLGFADDAGIRLSPLSGGSEDGDAGFIPLIVGRDEAVARAVAASVELRSAERSVRAAETRLEALKASRLSVNLSLDMEMKEWDAHPRFSAFVNASYNLADGGASDVQRREAELNLERARRALESARAKVETDVDSRLSNLAWLAEQVEFARRSLELAERSYAARMEQQRLGIASEKNVEDSRWAMEEARWAYIEAVVAYQAARWELLTLMGEELDVAVLAGQPSP